MAQTVLPCGAALLPQLVASDSISRNPRPCSARGETASGTGRARQVDTPVTHLEKKEVATEHDSDVELGAGVHDGVGHEFRNDEPRSVRQLVEAPRPARVLDKRPGDGGRCR